MPTVPECSPHSALCALVFEEALEPANFERCQWGQLEAQFRGRMGTALSQIDAPLGRPGLPVPMPGGETVACPVQNRIEIFLGGPGGARKPSASGLDLCEGSEDRTAWNLGVSRPKPHPVLGGSRATPASCMHVCLSPGVQFCTLAPSAAGNPLLPTDAKCSLVLSQGPWHCWVLGLPSPSAVPGHEDPQRVC